MQAGRLFAAEPAVEVRVYHFADDRSGANDRDLHHDVVELLWTHARQRGHLRAAFHLEHADGVGSLQRVIDRRVALRKVREIDLGAHLQRLLDYGEHTESEEIDLDDPHIGTVFLVPLNYHAAGHGGGFERHHGIERVLANHHAAGVLSEMARQVLSHLVELAELTYARMIQVEAGVAE